MFAPLPPETLIFNCYRIVGLAGQGEFGLTYLARDQSRFDELCMVKEFIPFQQDPIILEMLRQRFHQSAALLYEMQHLQLPHFRIMFAHHQRLYLVRDYVMGKSCGAMINDRRAESRVFSQAEVLQLLLQTLPVLDYLHRLGLIHQNLGPHSIVLRQPDQQPVLVDFGLVKQLTLSLRLHPIAPDTLVWQVGYAPPEQLSGGKLLPCSDLYSLGATAIALLTGKEPGDLQGHWGRSPAWELQVALYPEFARILKRMVHPNPDKRFATANHIQRALAAIAPLMLVTEEAHHQGMGPSTAAPSSWFGSAQPRSPHPLPPQMPHSQRSFPQNLPDPRMQKPFDRPMPAMQKQGSGRNRMVSAKKSIGKLTSQDWRASAILIGSVALLGGVVSWRALSWMEKTVSKPAGSTAQSTIAAPPSGSVAVNPPGLPTRDAGSTAAPTTTSPELAAQPAAKDLGDRRSQLGLNPQFLSALTDEMFYAKHPDLQGQKLGSEQARLQGEWTDLSNDLMTKLETLSPAVRLKLGSYQRADYDRWIAPGNGASLNSRELNVMVNNRFGELFPAQKGKTLNPKTFGQVWYAIADEELTKLKPQ